LHTSSPIQSRIFITKYLENQHEQLSSLTASMSSCKLYGLSSWTIILYMHISLELSWNAQTEYFGDFFQEFLSIQLIIQKSNISYTSLVFLTHCITRVLLACIKYLSHCPCQRCLVRKDEISALGTELDQHQHETQKQTDTQTRRRKVERVRKWIYEGGTTITSVFIK
jgi:hypothetical protein